MSYDDYLRPWKVLPPVDPSAKCQPEETVTFEGTADKVMITCGNRRPYGEGAYDEVSDTIKSKQAGGYVISMGEAGTGRARITLTPDGSVAGSWTAEDQSPWPEPEEG